VSERRTKTCQLEHVYIEDMTLQQVDAAVCEWRKGYSLEWGNLRLEYYDSTYSSNQELWLVGDRLETGDEYDKRIKWEQDCREARRRQYEALKKEFGDLNT
jgi:hypothetical protein